MTKWGLWVEESNRWAGWVGFASAGVFVPLAFDLEEARFRASRYLENCPGAVVSLRSDPPAEIAWVEAQGYATDGPTQVGII